MVVGVPTPILGSAADGRWPVTGGMTEDPAVVRASVQNLPHATDGLPMRRLMESSCADFRLWTGRPMESTSGRPMGAVCFTFAFA